MLGFHRSSGHHCYKYYHRHSSREGRGGPSRCRRPRRDIAVANRFFLKVRLAPFVFAFGRARSTISSDPCRHRVNSDSSFFCPSRIANQFCRFWRPSPKGGEEIPLIFVIAGRRSRILSRESDRLFANPSRLRFVLFFGFLSQGTFIPCPCFGLDYHYCPSLPRDHFQSSMLYLWSRFNGMDFLGE